MGVRALSAARQLESAPVATLRRHPGVRRYLWRKSCDFYGPALLVWCEPRRNRCAIRDRVHVLLTRRVRSHGRHGVRGGSVDLSFRSTGRTHCNSRGEAGKARKKGGAGGRSYTERYNAGATRPTQIPMLGRPAWRPGRGRLGSTHDGPLTVLGRTATPQPITGRDRITKNETEDDSVHSGREASKQRAISDLIALASETARRLAHGLAQAACRVPVRSSHTVADRVTRTSPTRLAALWAARSTMNV